MLQLEYGGEYHQNGLYIVGGDAATCTYYLLLVVVVVVSHSAIFCARQIVAAIYTTHKHAALQSQIIEHKIHKQQTF